MNARFAQSISRQKFSLSPAAGLAALLIAVPLICAEAGGAPPGAGPPQGAAAQPRTASQSRTAAQPRETASRPVVVDRSTHGSVRHVETHVVERPVVVSRPAAVERPAMVERRPEVRPEPERRAGVPREAQPRPEYEPRYGGLAHRDVEVDIHRRHSWNDFVFGRRLAALPPGVLSLHIGGAPYYYNDGVYYQPAEGGYQEVYPPVGAAVPQPPDGAIEIYAGGQTYYYAGGAFYLQQPDGSYAIAPTPIGVVVPELPPGAVQVSVRGTTAYQFNGIYYEPVFVNGVTQYETFMP
jgi:Family of unknown function (DUF6515)